MEKIKVAVIGLGYVGLPLARLFATRYPVVGFDVKHDRVAELKSGHDATMEVPDEILASVLLPYVPGELETGLYCSSNLDDIRSCNYYIITVPTPIDKHHNPDLTPLYRASETVGKVINKGDIVIYESTVYPGVTEDECVPVIEKISGLVFNKDFYAGYSPERINPGDKEHTVEKIKKITSGSTFDVAEKVDAFYHSVITAGTFKTSCIRVAEAAKVIENAQRDINIAFVNELAKIFNVLGIDTSEVLEAASTKWNFLPFKPGLVGGHCIGVDPYYLAQIAQDKGYHPEVILAGRRINDTMGEYIANQVIKLMIRKDIPVRNADVLVMGFTFKENCPDVRNTKVYNVVQALQDYGMKVTIYDPWAKSEDVLSEYGLTLTNIAPVDSFDAIVMTVAHTEFKESDIRLYAKDNSVIYDVKGCLNPSWTDGRL